jgi:PPM family protein phosphatase
MSAALQQAMSPRLTPLYSARTDAGRVRQINEDYVFAGALVGADGGTVRHLLVVADGVGGLERGEWASERAVQVLTAELPVHLLTTDAESALRLSMQAANQRVWQEADARSTSVSGPAATTLVAALIEGKHVWWANVGDSRIYLIGESEIQRLSRDHSWVEEQVRAGWLTPEEARRSGRRNLITRGIGYHAEVEVDTGGPLGVRLRDCVLLCSDGLHSMLADDEIAQVVRTHAPASAVEHLVDMSNRRGGPDNISVIICGFAVSEVEDTAADSIGARGQDGHAP